MKKLSIEIMQVKELKSSQAKKWNQISLELKSSKLRLKSSKS